jgi:hypothetical protein
MSHLLYAILGNHGPLSEPLPQGPDGHPVALLPAGELAAAFSVVPAAYGTPAAAQLLAYARVIDALHRLTTVVPLRYGCLLEGEADVRGLLQTRRAEFTASLAALTGCVEMGLRLLPAHAPCEGGGGAASAPRGPAACSSGTAYLAARQARQAADTARRRQAGVIAEGVRRTFSPVAVRFAAETPPARATDPLSFHFLIRRTDGPRFEDIFRHFQAGSPDPMLLTGPWPPYHFASDAGGGEHHVERRGTLGK